jgi:hypothetical protein
MYAGPHPSCFDYLESVEIFAPAATQCLELIEQGNFTKGSSSATGWYHSGSGVQVEEFEGSGSALVTSHHRGSFLHGPVFFVDTRCIVQIGDIIEYTAKIRLIGEDGHGAEACDPSNPHSMMRCPSANIIISHGGQQTAAYWDFAKVNGNWSMTEWNIMSGSIEVDHSLVAADSVAILVARCRKSVRIVINDVSAKIRQPDRTCKDLVRNGYFEKLGTSGWSVMGDEVKASVNDGVLYLTGREQWFHGIAQILNPSCFTVGSQVEVHAKVQLRTQDRFVSCYPGRLYLSAESCPNMNLRIQNQNGTEKFVEIGRTVGKFSYSASTEFLDDTCLKKNTQYPLFLGLKDLTTKTNGT